MQKIYDKDNIFAKILRNEIPCDVVYEDAFCLGLKDINPAAEVHILLIPKGEFVDYADFVKNALPEHRIAMQDSVLHITQMLGIDKSGYRIISNIGKDSNQEVPHYHIHILGGQRLGALIGA